jgi:hypothetical protein
MSTVIIVDAVLAGIGALLGLGFGAFYLVGLWQTRLIRRTNRQRLVSQSLLEVPVGFGILLALIVGSLLGWHPPSWVGPVALLGFDMALARQLWLLVFPIRKQEEKVND